MRFSSSYAVRLDRLEYRSYSEIGGRSELCRFAEGGWICIIIFHGRRLERAGARVVQVADVAAFPGRRGALASRTPPPGRRTGRRGEAEDLRARCPHATRRNATRRESLESGAARSGSLISRSDNRRMDLDADIPPPGRYSVFLLILLFPYTPRASILSNFRLPRPRVSTRGILNCELGGGYFHVMHLAWL